MSSRPHDISKSSWLYPITDFGVVLPAPAALRTHGTSAVTPVVHAPTPRQAARALSGSGRRPSRLVIAALNRWSLVQNGSRLDVGPITAALLAGRCDLADEQVTDILDAAVPGLPPLTDDMLEVLAHALMPSRRSVLTKLLINAASKSGDWQHLVNAGHLLVRGSPTRVAALACPRRWATRVVRRVETADVGDPKIAGSVDRTTTPGGRDITAVRTVQQLIEVGRDWDLCLEEEISTWANTNMQFFTVHADGSQVAVGHLDIRWYRIGIGGLQGPGNASLAVSVVGDVRRHLMGRLQQDGHVVGS